MNPAGLPCGSLGSSLPMSLFLFRNERIHTVWLIYETGVAVPRMQLFKLQALATVRFPNRAAIANVPLRD
jgi:hypothetical protein